MTSREYLQQAYRLDQRIDSKIEQLSSLRALATRATSTLSDVPPSGTRNVNRMEDVILKMEMLEDEIRSDLEELVDLKHELITVIKQVDHTECRILLELRYLCFKTWEQIAVEMDCCIDNVYKLHRKALRMVRVPERGQG